MIGLSEEPKDKKYLIKPGIIRALSSCCLFSCSETNINTSEELFMEKSAIIIIYNLTIFIPTDNDSYDDKFEYKNSINKIIHYGGYAALAYVEHNCTIEPIKELCKSLKLSQYLKKKNLKQTINSVLSCLKRNENSSNLPDINESKEPERNENQNALKSINYNELLGYLQSYCPKEKAKIKSKKGKTILNYRT